METIRMDFPKVSIRIALYNHENYIVEALESVRQDSYANKELVIIDDGSTDNSAAVAQQWLDDTSLDFPVIFKSRKNKGITKTLNELIGLCSGDYFVSLASDDCLIVGGIEKRLAYLLENQDKLAVIGDCHVIDGKGAPLFQSGLSNLYKANLDRYQSVEGILNEVITNWSVPGSLLMVRRDIYDLISDYNEKLEIEDWDFYMRMTTRGLLGFVNEPIANYRLHDSNTSRTSKNKLWRYKQLMLSAWYNLPTVPVNYKIFLLRKMIWFGCLIFATRFLRINR